MNDNNCLHTLAVDIGGSGIKAMVLDETGKATTDRERIDTPDPATPTAVIDVISALAEKQCSFDRISVGFPGVVEEGVTKSAANLDDEWLGFDLKSAVRQKLGKPVKVKNDAEIQGYGAISGEGVELVITLGTGFGSALFVDGKLMPNLELAHHDFRKGKTYEQQLKKQQLKKKGKKKWNKRLKKAIASLESAFHYDRLYIGGGRAKKIDFDLPDNVTIIPNVAGILGGIALWNESSDLNNFNGKRNLDTADKEPLVIESSIFLDNFADVGRALEKALNPKAEAIQVELKVRLNRGISG